MAESMKVSKLKAGMAVRFKDTSRGGAGRLAIVLDLPDDSCHSTKEDIHLLVFGKKRTFFKEYHFGNNAHRRSVDVWVEYLGPASVVPIMSKTDTVKRFTITHHSEANWNGYKVNIPNYAGGEVVDAKAHDVLVGKLRDELSLALQALSDLNSAQTNLIGRTQADLKRLQANTEGLWE